MMLKVMHAIEMRRMLVLMFALLTISLLLFSAASALNISFGLIRACNLRACNRNMIDVVCLISCLICDDVMALCNTAVAFWT